MSSPDDLVTATKNLVIATNNLGQILKDAGANMAASPSAGGTRDVWVDDYGAIGDGITEDSAAIQAAFNHISTTDTTIPVNFTGGKTYYIATGITLPTPSDSSTFYIRGNGCTIRTDQAIVMMHRIPTSNGEANTIISQCIFDISGIEFEGTQLAGQVGLHLAAAYTPVVEHCHFLNLQYGSIGTFCLSGSWRDLRYTNCTKRPFLLQTSGGYDGSAVWSGGAVGSGDSNSNMIDNCRVFGIAGQLASFTIAGSDGCVLHKCISEGNGDSVDVKFDYQSSSLVKMFSVYDLHCEAPSQKVNLQIASQGTITLHNIIRTYPAAIIDAKGSVGVHFIMTGLAYLGNMPVTPWFYHTDGGGYGGTPGGNSSGSVFSFKSMAVGNIFATDLVLASNWENNTQPIYEVEAEGSADGGRFMRTNSFYLTCYSAYIRNREDTAFAPVQGKLTTHTNYTGGAPSATGYLTIYDATGTAYKVLVST